MKLILVGKAAAGKDFLKNRLVAKNFKPGISCTTRLPRHNEVDGVYYHFMTEDQFKETIDSGEMLEHMIFNNWYYGLTKEEARESFETVLEEFVKYTHNKKTIFQELENLGWAVNKRKKRVVSPDFEDLLSENEHFRHLYKSKDLVRDSSNVNLELA